MTRRGFAFVQVALVAAGLLVVWAILAPMFARPRCGRVTTCPNNLRQVAIAATMYTEDYDGRFPCSSVAGPAEPDPADHVAAVTWDEALSPYVKSMAVWRCPDDPLPRNVPARTYAANGWVTGAGYCDPNAMPGAPRDALAAKDVKDPASTFLFGERWNPDRRRVIGRADFHVVWDEPARWGGHHPGPDDEDGATYAFADGHVKWLSHDAVRRHDAGCRWR